MLINSDEYDRENNDNYQDKEMLKALKELNKK